jgi:hypothetical protein
MTPTVEQLCETMEGHRLLSSAELSQMRTRWFRAGRKEVADLDKFGQWLAVNGYLTAFAFRMLQSGKADLLHLNQYQLVDHLTSGPFSGSYLATDPLRRRVVLDILAAANPEGVRAFQSAAERAMTVRHPNVGQTLDFGEGRGRHYLVREFDEGETLADILARRGKLQPVSAARIFASAFQGLQALHDKQVPAGPLDPDCLILAVAGKSPSDKSRLVKILSAGVPRTMFDPNALGDAPAVKSSEPAPGEAKDDLFRLGVLFYRALTGQPPFGAEATGRATPVGQLAPEVPSMLAHLVESLIDPDPAQRPGAPSFVAKSLRVFLASEEEAQHNHPEDHLAPQQAAPVSAPAPEAAVAEHGNPAAPAAAAGQPAGEGTLALQWKALWEELRPSQRDLVFLALGAAGVILLVLFLNLLTGIHFVNLVCLLAGGALSFFVERLLHLREESSRE